MKQLFVITIIIAVLAGVVIFMIRSKNSDEQVPQSTPVAIISPENHGEFVAMVPLSTPNSVVFSTPNVVGTTVAVSITDEAFEPATVNISVGDTVVFTNNGQALHWPASDPHPTHTNYSKFDAKKGIATGETYSYTFTEAGTYGMHDHLNAKVKGTIIVE